MSDGNQQDLAEQQLARQGIFDGFSGYVTPADDDWADVLEQGLVVVDTNVLLNLYRYNESARDSLLDALSKFGTRLWVPHQVMLEFWRNRDSALEDHGTQLRQTEEALEKHRNGIRDNLRRWGNRMSLDRETLHGFERRVDDTVDDVIEKMRQVVDVSRHGMEKATHKDQVLKRLAVLLQDRVGAPLDAQTQVKCVSEARRRIENRVPPGYRVRRKRPARTTPNSATTSSGMS